MIAVSLRSLVAVVALAQLAGCSRASAPTGARSAGARRADSGRDSFVRHAPRLEPGCPALARVARSEGSLHGDTVAGVERWLAAESPHRVPYGLHVHPGGEVTLEPCALVLVGPGAEIVVHGGASLRASGTIERPIRFARLDRAHAWQAVELRAEARADTSLDGVVLEGAGAPPSERGVAAASLRVAMRSGLHAAGLSIIDGESWGVAVLGEGRFADRDETLLLRGLRGGGAITVEDVNRVADLPRLRFEDNARNDVRVEARVRILSADARWRSLGAGARYVVRAATHIVVEGDRGPALILEAGTHVAFGADAELDVGFGARGALVAEGDRLHPVVFDGADSERWVGVQLGPQLDVGRSRLTSVRIEHAGAASGTVLPTCGCEDAHPDEAMLTLQGIQAPDLLRDVRFVDGPPTGFAVVVAGDFPQLTVPPSRPEDASDITQSRVRCARSQPLVRGTCGTESRRSSESL